MKLQRYHCRICGEDHRELECDYSPEISLALTKDEDLRDANKVQKNRTNRAHHFLEDEFRD